MKKSATIQSARASKARSAEAAQHHIDLSALAASMGHVPDTKEVAALAAEFARVMRTYLTPAEMDAVVATNEARELIARAKGKKNETCATHDYCDANMVMDEAMHNLGHSTDGDPDEAGWGDLWNRAWGRAKDMNFDVELLNAYAATF